MTPEQTELVRRLRNPAEEWSVTETCAAAADMIEALASWRDIKDAPKGCITEDVGCRGQSEWFIGRVARQYRQGRPPFIVIRRRAWPQEDSWSCAGETCYVPEFFDAWMPLPAPPVQP
jgi:hypothetical protein